MATTTITTSASEDNRLQAAFGAYLRLGRNATGAEIKAALITFAKDVVRQYEQNQAANSIGADIAPT